MTTLTDVPAEPRIDWTTTRPEGEDGLVLVVTGPLDHTWMESFASVESGMRGDGLNQSWRAVTVHADPGDESQAALHVRAVQPHTEHARLRAYLDALVSETNAESARRHRAHVEALRLAAEEAQHRRDAVSRLADALRAA